MKQKAFDYLLALVGFALLAAGLYLVKRGIASPEIFKALPYVSIGLGCGIFGHDMGSIISRKAIQHNPDIQKQVEIEKKDERNIALANRAKAKAYDLMLFVFGALMLAFALLGVDLAVILLLVLGYLLVIFYFIYYLAKYNREM
ncbi:MAG TPA: hypothetical protein GXX75_26165 [Clostridiales bacterium]|nr:hypothetical protein [Clostridiales bacterium]